MMLDFLAAVLALALLGGAGMRLISLAKFERQRKLSELEKIVFSLSLSGLVVSFALLAMGMAGLFSPVAFLVLALLLAAFAGKMSFDFVKLAFSEIGGAVAFAKQSASKPLSLSFLCFVAVAVLLALHFLYALSPPVAYASGPKDVDSLGYHLAVPKLYALMGGISFLDFQPNSNWPFAMQMLYVPGFAFGLDGYAKLLQFGFSLALLAAIILLSRKVLGGATENALVSIAVFLSSQAVSFSFGGGTVDLVFALYSCLAFLALLEWRENLRGEWLLLSAVFAGGIAATKLNGFVLLPVFAAAVAFCAFVAARENNPKKQLALAFVPALKAVVLFSIVAGLVVSPWLAKTFYFTGNPIWPIYSNSFAKLGFADNGSAGWTHLLENGRTHAGCDDLYPPTCLRVSVLRKLFQLVPVLNSFAGGFVDSAGGGVEDLLSLPFDITFTGNRFGGLLTPLFLALLPLLLFVRRPKHLDFLLGASVLYLVLWFYSFREVRYLFPILPIWSIGAAHAITSATNAFKQANSHKYGAFLLKGVLLLVLVATVAVTFAYKANALPVAVGLEPQESFLLRSQYNYAAAEWINQNTAVDAKVLLVGDNNPYYLDRHWIHGTHWFVIYRVDLMNQSQFLDFLSANGVTYLLFNSESLLKDDPKKEQIRPLVEGVLLRSVELFEANGMKVYKLPQN